MGSRALPIDLPEGWLDCLKELGTPAKHLAWSAVVPEVEIPDPLEPYLPILVLDFNEEEYANQAAEDEAKGNDEVGDFVESDKHGE